MPSKHDHLDSKYRYRRHGQDSALLGKAAWDAANSGGFQTAEETGQQMGQSYIVQLFEVADANVNKFADPFHIVVLRKKMVVGGILPNTMHCTYVARQTKPELKELATFYGSYDCDLYEVSKSKGDVSLVYTLPSQDMWDEIIKNDKEWDPSLVKWVIKAKILLDEELKKPI